MIIPQELDYLLDAVQSGLRSVQRGFDQYQQGYFTERSGEFFCLELNGEAGELANLEKKRWKGKPISDEELADEAADVLIRLCNYANARHINLSEAVHKKLITIEHRRQELEQRDEKY